MKKQLTATLIAAMVASTALPAFAQQGAGDGTGPMGEGPMAEEQMGPMGQMAMERFETLDADGDGSVTAEEMSAHRAAQIAGLDADGDGFLTAEELNAHFNAQSAERNARRVERMMERSDFDGDGKIGAAEMMLNAGGAQMGERFFDRADVDGDGAVSREEAEAMLAQMAERRNNRGEGRMRGGDHERGQRGGHGGQGRGWFGRN